MYSSQTFTFTWPQWNYTNNNFLITLTVIILVLVLSEKQLLIELWLCNDNIWKHLTIRVSNFRFNAMVSLKTEIFMEVKAKMVHDWVWVLVEFDTIVSGKNLRACQVSNKPLLCGKFYLISTELSNSTL